MPKMCLAISWLSGQARREGGLCLGERHLSRHAVRVRPAHRRIAHHVLEPAMFALDPDAGRQVVPIPRPLSAAGARFRVGWAHHRAPIVDLAFNLSETLPRSRTEGRFRRTLCPRRSASMSIESPI